jgi:hypothetical protein
MPATSAPGPGVERQVGGVTGIQLGLAGVEPPGAHAQVVVVVLHRRPDRHHQPHAQLAQVAHHRVRIRVLGRIEPVIAHRGPVKKVGHDHRQRQATAAVLARHREQFLLAARTQSCLSKPGRGGRPGRLDRDAQRPAGPDEGGGDEHVPRSIAVVSGTLAGLAAACSSPVPLIGERLLGQSRPPGHDPMPA